jgi:hypothetical protein
LKTIFTYLFLFLASSLAAQNVVKKTKSAHKASVLSTVIPGAGQVYNKKYWKVPIVYATMGTALYFANENMQSFKKYKNALENRNNGQEDLYPNVSDSEMLTVIDFYQRNRDISYILTAVAYILNIVDASVDAHLFDFNINENLSVSTQTTINTNFNNIQPVLSFQIKL